MRAYSIRILNKDGSEFLAIDSQPSGSLHIELDAVLTADFGSSSYVTLSIYGLPIKYQLSAKDMQEKYINIYGGHKPGLPLANPSQYGLIVKGAIFFSTGIREGNQNYITLSIYPSSFDFGYPSNTTIVVKKGENAGAALKQSIAASGYGGNINVVVSQKNIAQSDMYGAYASFEQMCYDVYEKFKISIIFNSSTGSLDIFDDEIVRNPPKIKTIEIFDSIGQPTFTGIETATAKLSLRGDIFVGDTIKIVDKVLTRQTRDAFAVNTRSRLGFKGLFFVNSTTHTASYYSKDDASWSTTLELFYQQ
jgi:hypothetical protein